MKEMWTTFIREGFEQCDQIRRFLNNLEYKLINKIAQLFAHWEQYDKIGYNICYKNSPVILRLFSHL